MDDFERLVRQYAHAEELRKVFRYSVRAGGDKLLEYQIPDDLSLLQRRILKADKGWSWLYRAGGAQAPLLGKGKRGQKRAEKSRVNQAFFHTYTKNVVEQALRDQAFHLCMRVAHNDWVWDEAPYKKGKVDVIRSLVKLEDKIVNTQGGFPGLGNNYNEVREAFAERIAIMAADTPYMPRMPEEFQ